MMARDTPRPDVAHWRDRAACRTRTDLNWFPARGERFEEQRTVCAGCPVRPDCLALALSQDENDDFGFWAGTSARERTTMRRARR